MGRGPGVRVVGPEGVQLDFRWKGQRHRPRLRLAPTKANLEFCKRWKRRIEDEIALGKFVWEEHFPNHPNPAPGVGSGRLRDLLLAYVKSLAGQIQPETLKEYEQNAEIVAAGLHNPTLDKLDRAKFRTWIASLDLSKNRIDNLLTPVRALNFRDRLGCILVAVLAPSGELKHGPAAILELLQKDCLKLACVNLNHRLSPG